MALAKEEVLLPTGADFIFCDRVSLCICDWPGAHHIDLPDLKLSEIGLPLPP